MQAYSEIKQIVLEASKKAYRLALFAGTSGNLSLRDKKSGAIAITPSDIDYEKMREEDIVVLDLEGQRLEGDLPPSSEHQMHLEIYRMRPDIQAVVHTHSPFATACAASHQVVPVILTEMVHFLLGSIPLAGYRQPGTIELGQVVVEALSERNACLMANHGAVAVGGHMDEALTAAIYAEDASKIFLLSKLAGTPQVIAQAEVNKIKGESY